jgi:hypothetical protein
VRNTPPNEFVQSNKKKEKFTEQKVQTMKMLQLKPALLVLLVRAVRQLVQQRVLPRAEGRQRQQLYSVKKSFKHTSEVKFKLKNNSFKTNWFDGQQ